LYNEPKCYPFQTADTFKFAKEQRVYVVAVETGSRNLNATSGNLQLERLAKNQFKKERSFRIATTLREADFVFFVVLASFCRETQKSLLCSGLTAILSGGVEGQFAIAALPNRGRRSQKCADVEAWLGLSE